MKQLKTISKYRFKNFCEFVQNVGELGHELYVQRGVIDRYFLINGCTKENDIIPIILEIQGPPKNKEELSQ